MRTTQEEVNSCLAPCEWKCEVDGLPVVVNLEKKDEFITVVVKYYAIMKCEAMLRQLLEGLKYFDLLISYIVAFFIVINYCLLDYTEYPKN